MKILIAGTDLNAIILAQYIKLQNKDHDIYVTSDTESKNEYYTAISINENDIQSLCDFVKYNQIEFTIVTSSMSIINGIADLFRKEGFPVFAPLSEAARITFFNSISKKIMYKLKINTPKFGIFDRENLSLEYVRRSRFPIVIKNDFTLLYRETNVYKTFSQAKAGLQRIFENNNEKIVIENYIDSNPLYVYFITDGYNALPLITLDRTVNEGYTSISAPCEKIPDRMIVFILRNVIYPLLDDINKYAGNYTGIIGLEIKRYANTFYVLEFYNGFQHYDLQAFLSVLDDDLLGILYDAANGHLTDNHNYIETIDNYSYTVAIDKSKVTNKDDNDFMESDDGNKLIYTNTASTLNYAKKDLIEYIKNSCDREIYEKLNETENKRKLRV